ncbi:MAG: hypothetical protein NTU59_00260 [Coprothermobacterota bacterium]|nr:hypothetical protein [Coprothermobacterota bacterium]
MNRVFHSTIKHENIPRRAWAGSMTSQPVEKNERLAMDANRSICIAGGGRLLGDTRESGKAVDGSTPKEGAM